MNFEDELHKFCSDDELGYLRSRTRFAAGKSLQLDDAYRLAHLPLVAPAHPDAIAARDGAPYRDGRRPESYSLVMPLDDALLRRSQPFAALEDELRTSPFADKIAWPIVAQRRDKLHATLCGFLGQVGVPRLGPDQLRALANIGPVQIEVRGLFSGNVNIGRLYLRVYPERRGGYNAFHLIQQALGRNETDLFLVGMYNLTDHLDARESDALSALLERWWCRSLLRMDIRDLWLLGATDDLVLESRVVKSVALTAGA